MAPLRSIVGVPPRCSCTTQLCDALADFSLGNLSAVCVYPQTWYHRPGIFPRLSRVTICNIPRDHLHEYHQVYCTDVKPQLLPTVTSSTIYATQAAARRMQTSLYGQNYLWDRIQYLGGIICSSVPCSQGASGDAPFAQVSYDLGHLWQLYGHVYIIIASLSDQVRPA